MRDWQDERIPKAWDVLRKWGSRLWRLHLLEPLALPVLFMVFLLASSFEEVIGDVLEGETRPLDMFILRSLRHPDDLSDPLGPWWLEEIMRDFTALGGTGILTLLTLTAAAYMLIIRRRFRAFYLMIAIASGAIVSNLLKAGFDRPRPDFVPHEVYVTTASLPSGHSLMAALVYLTLGALLAEIQPMRRLKLFVMVVAIIIAFVVGCSRVYLGVHWPSDVLAGWLAGAIWALMFWIGERYILIYMARRNIAEK